MVAPGRFNNEDGAETPGATALGSEGEGEMEIRKVGVLGCGLMGAGIAQVAASAGFETIVREVSDDLITKGFSGIEKSLAKFAEKGTITADQQREIRGRPGRDSAGPQ